MIVICYFPPCYNWYVAVATIVVDDGVLLASDVLIARAASRS